jgi:hypothetical protein
MDGLKTFQAFNTDFDCGIFNVAQNGICIERHKIFVGSISARKE